MKSSSLNTQEYKQLEEPLLDPPMYLDKPTSKRRGSEDRNIFKKEALQEDLRSRIQAIDMKPPRYPSSKSKNRRSGGRNQFNRRKKRSKILEYGNQKNYSINNFDDDLNSSIAEFYQTSINNAGSLMNSGEPQPKRIKIDSSRLFLKNFFFWWIPSLKSVLLDAKGPAVVLPEDLQATKIQKKLFLAIKTIGAEEAMDDFAWLSISSLIFPLTLFVIIRYASIYLVYKFLYQAADNNQVLMYTLYALIAFILSEFFNNVFYNYCLFRTEKYGIFLEAVMQRIVQNKVFRKSFERDHSFRLKDFDFLLTSIPKYMIYLVRRKFTRIAKLLHFTASFFLLAYLVDTGKFFVVTLVLFFLMSAIYSMVKGCKLRNLEEYLRLRDRRSQFVLDVLKNGAYVKIRGWGCLFGKMINLSREKELGQLKRYHLIDTVWVVSSWMLTFLGMVFMVLFEVSSKFNQASIFGDGEKDGKGMDPALLARHKVIDFLIFYSALYKTYILLRDGVGLGKVNINSEKLYSTLDEFLKGEEVEPRHKEDLQGVNLTLKFNDGLALLMKDCSFVWDAKGAQLYSRQRSRLKAEQERLQISLERKKRRKKYLQKIESMRAVSDGSQGPRSTSMSRSIAYTLNTVAEGKEQVFNEKYSTKERRLGSETKEYTLESIDLTVKRKEFCFVLGLPSSGKSSLLKAILGEMKIELKERPVLKTVDRVFYIGSEPWILDGSLKENVVMDRRFDRGRFIHAVKHSLLVSSLRAMGLDYEEEAGFEENLRMNCLQNELSYDPLFKLKIEAARCIYANPELVLIDDSFRYFNGKDSYKLFYTFIKNGLRNSAVIYTSRRRRFINLCDSFAILDQGKILKQGRKDELVDVFDELFLENIGSPGGREGSVGRKYGKLNDYGATASRNQSYKDPSMTPSSLKDDFNIYGDSSTLAMKALQHSPTQVYKSPIDTPSRHRLSCRVPLSSQDASSYNNIKLEEHQILQSINPHHEKLRLSGAKNQPNLAAKVNHAMRQKSRRTLKYGAFGNYFRKAGTYPAIFLVFFACAVYIFGQVMFAEMISQFIYNTEVYEMNDARVDQFLQVVLYSVITFIGLPIAEIVVLNFTSTKISQYLHNLFISNIFDFDIYEMITNIPTRLYNLNITQEIADLDRDFDFFYGKFVRAICFTIAFSALLGAFVNPFFPFIPIFASAFLLVKLKGSYQSVKIFNHMRQGLRFRHRSLLKDVIIGLNNIRAANSQLFFKVKLDYFLEREMLSKLYISGYRYRLILFGKLIGLFGVSFVICGLIYGIYMVDQVNYGEETGQRAVDLLVFAIVSSFVPLVFGQIAGSFDGLMTQAMSIDTTLSLTDFETDHQSECERMGLVQDTTHMKRRKTLRMNRKLAISKFNLTNSGVSTEKPLIIFRNVQIYDDRLNGSPKIKTLNLSIPPKQKVAILSDLSTPVSAIFDLLLQLNLETSGATFLDSRDISTLKLQDVRKETFYLNKEIPLFATSLRKNIHPLYPDATNSSTKLQIFSILKMFNFSNPRFPDLGLELPINPLMISPDDRTAIGMTRLFMDPKSICLLDSIDARFDFGAILKFGEMLLERLNDSTVIMICERAVTAKFFDRVVIFREGMVVEDGDPRVLSGGESVGGHVGNDAKVEAGTHFSRMLRKEREIFS